MVPWKDQLKDEADLERGELRAVDREEEVNPKTKSRVPNPNSDVGIWDSSLGAEFPDYLDRRLRAYLELHQLGRVPLAAFHVEGRACRDRACRSPCPSTRAFGLSMRPSSPFAK